MTEAWKRAVANAGRLVGRAGVPAPSAALVSAAMEKEKERHRQALVAVSEPLTVYIVLEVASGRDAIDGVHTDESTANRRRDELNLREDDSGFACVVAKYVKTPEGYLQARSPRPDTP